MNINKKQKIILIIIGCIIITIIGYYTYIKIETIGFNEIELKEESTTKIIKEEKEEEKILEKKIIVHIAGAVKNEGVVELKESSRIEDAIEAVGGITEEADMTNINLAYILEDGQKIYIPTKEDTNTGYITKENGEDIITNMKIEDKSMKEEKSKVNINNANQVELETLPGIGPSTALKIINYRKENGKFKNIEDIKNVPGIGESKYEQIKDSIIVK